MWVSIDKRDSLSFLLQDFSQILTYLRKMCPKHNCLFLSSVIFPRLATIFHQSLESWSLRRIKGNSHYLRRPAVNLSWPRVTISSTHPDCLVTHSTSKWLPRRKLGWIIWLSDSQWQVLVELQQQKKLFSLANVQILKTTWLSLSGRYIPAL